MTRKTTLVTLFCSFTISSFSISSAATISEQLDGDNVFSSDTRFRWGMGTVVSGSSTNDNLSFSFLSNNTNALKASGRAYLLSAPYIGTPGALSSSTPGYLSTTVAVANVWTFDPSVTVTGGSTVYIYTTDYVGSVGGVFAAPVKKAGDVLYSSVSGGAFAESQSASMYAYRLSGSPASIPEPSQALLLLLGMVPMAMRRR